jgi:hypothetical protein
MEWWSSGGLGVGVVEKLCIGARLVLGPFRVASRGFDDPVGSGLDLVTVNRHDASAGVAAGSLAPWIAYDLQSVRVTAGSSDCLPDASVADPSDAHIA